MNSPLLAATLSLTFLAPLGSLLAAPPRPSAPVLVLVPPWIDAVSLVASAGGRVVGPASAPMAVLAYSDDSEFAQNLLRSGALGVRDGSVLADLCGAKGSRT